MWGPRLCLEAVPYGTLPAFSELLIVSMVLVIIT